VINRQFLISVLPVETQSKLYFSLYVYTVNEYTNHMKPKKGRFVT